MLLRAPLFKGVLRLFAATQRFYRRYWKPLFRGADFIDLLGAVAGA